MSCISSDMDLVGDGSFGPPLFAEVLKRVWVYSIKC